MSGKVARLCHDVRANIESYTVEAGKDAPALVFWSGEVGFQVGS